MLSEVYYPVLIFFLNILDLSDWVNQLLQPSHIQSEELSLIFYPEDMRGVPPLVISKGNQNTLSYIFHFFLCNFQSHSLFLYEAPVDTYELNKYTFRACLLSVMK